MTIGIANGKLPALDIVIVNYDILKKYSDGLRSITWDMLIIDECHLTKNPKAIRSRQVWGEKEKKAPYDWILPPIPARRRIALTGTPIANRPIEAWPILNGLAPEEFNSFFCFAKRYCAAHQTGFGWDMTGSSKLPELQEKMRRSVMIRRLKADVLTELPPKRRQVVEIEPTTVAAAAVASEQEAWDRYESTMDEMRIAVELAKASDNPSEYETAVAKLRASSMGAFTEMSRLRHETAVAKIPMVIEHVEASIEQGGKCVLFAHHKDVIAAIAERFGGSCVTLTGDTSLPNRQAAVERFQSDPTCTLFIGNILAAGVGLTLTASSHVIFAELDWVPGNVTQAEDRCHRIGQTDSVLVQHLVLDGSLDARMAKILIEKQDVIDRALDKQSEQTGNAPTMPSKQRAATESFSRAKVCEEAAKLTEDQIDAILTGLQLLAGVCDGAFTLDGQGFNKFDSAIGKALASASTLTPRRAALGAKLVSKYRRQLPKEIVEAAKGN